MEWIKAPNVKEGVHPPKKPLIFHFVFSQNQILSLFSLSKRDCCFETVCVCVKGKEDVWESKGFFFFTRQLGETIFQDPQRRHSLYLRYSLSWIKSCALLFCFN
jgi:hypothetical protein